MSALALDSPPFSVASAQISSENEWATLLFDASSSKDHHEKVEQNGFTMPEFSFEPYFPCLVLERNLSSPRSKSLEYCRLVKEGANYAEVYGDMVDREDDAVLSAFWEWVDEQGY